MRYPDEGKSTYDSYPFVWIETRSAPALTHGLPLYVDHSHCLVLAPATLAALPSTRAIPGRDVFYVVYPIRSIETRVLPTRARCYPRSFTFYVAHPIASFRLSEE